MSLEVTNYCIWERNGLCEKECTLPPSSSREIDGTSYCNDPNHGTKNNIECTGAQVRSEVPFEKDTDELITP